MSSVSACTCPPNPGEGGGVQVHAGEREGVRLSFQWPRERIHSVKFVHTFRELQLFINHGRTLYILHFTLYTLHENLRYFSVPKTEMKNWKLFRWRHWVETILFLNFPTSIFTIDVEKYYYILTYLSPWLSNKRLKQMQSGARKDRVDRSRRMLKKS